MTLEKAVAGMGDAAQTAMNKYEVTTKTAPNLMINQQT
jgi:hypothetical protein